MAGRPISTRYGQLPLPAVCAPLVARTTDALVEECAAVVAKRADLLEWRVDFFDRIADPVSVLETARALHMASAGVPLLFTRRSAREGGEKISVDEAHVVEIYDAVCTSGLVDLVDVEMDGDAAQVREVQAVAGQSGAKTVLSFHDFHSTPTVEELVSRFERAYTLGADIAKIAVMPRTHADVLALLSATKRAADELPIPVVSMAMGPLGAVTRAAGWVFGSAMTFAVGRSSSAPGQMPIEDVRAVIEALRRAS